MTVADGQLQHRLEGLFEPCLLLGDPTSDTLEDLGKHFRRHTGVVAEALGVLPLQLDHKLVIQAELPPPQDPGSRPELWFALSSSSRPATLGRAGQCSAGTRRHLARQ